MGGYRGTASEISRIIEENPNNAVAWYNRGNDLSSCGLYHEAISDYTKALQLGLRFREAIEAYGNRGIARKENGDLDGAMQDFSEVISRQPRNDRILKTAYMQRAAIKQQKGDQSGAIEDRQRAQLLNPEPSTTR